MIFKRLTVQGCERDQTGLEALTVSALLVQIS